MERFGKDNHVKGSFLDLVGIVHKRVFEKFNALVGLFDSHSDVIARINASKLHSVMIMRIQESAKAAITMDHQHY